MTRFIRMRSRTYRWKVRSPPAIPAVVALLHRGRGRLAERYGDAIVQRTQLRPSGPTAGRTVGPYSLPMARERDHFLAALHLRGFA